MWQHIKAWDTNVLILINKKLAHPWLDAVLPWLRESIFWLPLYVFLISWGMLNLGRKAGWWVASALFTVALSDQVSSGIIKNSVQRIRPCRDPEVLPLIQLRLEHCSGAFSFTSSHAANHFAVAMFAFISLAPVAGTRYTRWLFVWAAAISYAQMYVGVHYPLDIAGGTLVGLACGWLVATLYSSKTRNMSSVPSEKNTDL